mmetsp:Transcript_14545/g.31614  ORF Transcript_14545/g.31614 Transcript_14545/m.31614 type:complete len:897 (+) Transcript_14545:87-2777(+)
MTTPAAAEAADGTPMTTTRTCIKNLHPSFDETKLKSHLQSAQPSLLITDCKLLKTKDGKSRRIAFVGFQTASQAETAVSYFDKSYAGTARLSVSLAFSKKKGPPAASEYRPWSKHSVGSSRYAKIQEQQHEEQQISVEKKEKSRNNEAQEPSSIDAEASEINRKKEEFLSAMGISASSKQGGQDGKVSKSKFWGNDDAIVEPGAEQTNNANPNNDGQNETDEINESDGDSSSSSDSDSEDDEPNNAEKKKEGKNQVTSDLDFLKSKQVKADILTDESDNEGKVGDDSSASSGDSDYSSSVASDSSSEDENEADKSKGGQNNTTTQGSHVPESSGNVEDNKEAENAQPSSTLIDRLFVRNLPFTTTEEDIFEKFSEFGHVTTVHIPVDDSKRNKGYAFITFEHKKDAKLAMDTMDGADFQGRLIHILPARPSTDQDVDESDLTYKEKQTLARKKEAEKSSKGWSASFLRGDAVVDNLSNRLGVSKGDILNVKDGISSGNAAVRLALGETHIISENIAFFEKHGVDVTSLESKSNKKGKSGAPKRSKTMILVKNLPYDTSLEDLTKVFHGIGGDVPQKLLLPPSKTAALVEYAHATDARRAFRRLAYKKFKHVPLYLEWAPMQEGGKQESPTKDTKKDVQKQESSDTVVKQRLADEDPSTETADTGVSQTIYVKNLNFSTTEDQLDKAFTKAGFHPRAVKIPTKAATLKKNNASSATDSRINKETRQMSMGFGFVEFPSEDEALKAMKGLQGKVVDGHALEIKLSTKSLSSAKVPAIDKSSKNTKIMVRNVPFEATRTEILQLFGSFGQLKKVRLPKKFDGSHRGFAFCEFVTSKEAQNAMETLSRTHLYGRHLVLEWAAEGDGEGNVDVGASREKAKRDAMSAGLGGSAKKRKHLKF